MTDEVTFHCPEWPGCACPDGTFKLGCPALGNVYAGRQPEPKSGTRPRLAIYEALAGRTMEGT